MSKFPRYSSDHPSGLPNFIMKSAKSLILIKPVPCNTNRKIQVANTKAKWNKFTYIWVIVKPTIPELVEVLILNEVISSFACLFKPFQDDSHKEVKEEERN